ncbi:hypothetical protein KIW84_043593 [Lathyrus oleraceus]|uniref:Uncharacterized protein n=1 Tax=Pisum sativum TaxID=3888 RepID=A0A9D4XFQ1_PEA|nr:hypothetical protein KIW84_043593 [Pisum sativum]
MYPTHLDNLLDKHFAFRVKYQPYYKQASVDTTNMAIHSPDTRGKEIVTTESPVIPKALSQSSNQTTTASASDAQNWSWMLAITILLLRGFQEMVCMESHALQNS